MAGLVTPESIVVPDKKLESAGINVILDEVIKINPEKKSVTVLDGKELNYDKLILATGSSSFIPPIEGVEIKGVMSLRGLDDARKIISFIEDCTPTRIVFIGAGFITMEMASLIAAQNSDNIEITIVEYLSHPLPLMLDKDMAGPVAKHLKIKGIRILTNKKVENILGENGIVTGVQLASGEKIAWACQTRVDTVDRELLSLMKKAGCVCIHFGVESGNQEIMDNLLKKITKDKVREDHAECKKPRTEERRVGNECRSRCVPNH